MAWNCTPFSASSLSTTLQYMQAWYHSAVYSSHGAESLHAHQRLLLSATLHHTKATMFVA